MTVDTELPQPPSLGAMRAEGPVAIFLDFDGTLVDIAPTPDGIDVPADMARALHRLADQLDGRLALVSGRAIADVETHLGPLKIARAGSHGADVRLPDGLPLAAAPQQVSDAVRRNLAEFASSHGISAEEKPHGAALHYRSRPEFEDQALAFARQIAQANGMVIKQGKCVAELVYPGADKGSAVQAFMQHEAFAGSRPVFIGDDVTDEDGFAVVTDLGGTGILVGDRTPTKAQYRLGDPAAVHDWLGFAQ